MHTAGDYRAMPKARHDIKEALIARGPAIFMESKLRSSGGRKYEHGGGEAAKSSVFGNPSGRLQVSVNWRASSESGAVTDQVEAECFHGAYEGETTWSRRKM